MGKLDFFREEGRGNSQVQRTEQKARMPRMRTFCSFYFAYEIRRNGFTVLYGFVSSKSYVESY